MKHSDGSPFPAYRQELLLKAALLGGEEMQIAFEEWKKSVVFEKDIGYASFRMLPLLYQNLKKNRIDDTLMPRLKGIYRKSWSENHLLFYRAGNILDRLHHEGIKTLVLKGIPLTILYYKNFGVRPMSDMDILIPSSDVRRTIELLQQWGWRLYNPQYLEFNLKYGRSATFADHEKNELDLHWYPVFEVHNRITEEDFWKNAVPLEVGGIRTLSFSATDIFFHTIVHGLRYNPEPPFRWVADAVYILNSAGSSMDWERLLHHTKKFRVTLYMKDAVHYLTETFHVRFPEPFLKTLKNIPVTSIDRLVFRHAQKYGDKEPETLYQKVYSLYAAYMRQTSKTGFMERQIDFIKFLRYRTKGKPYLKILLYYTKLMFQSGSSGKK